MSGQLPLLAPGPSGVMTRDGWIGDGSLMGLRRHAYWTHPAYPDVKIRHCGHPTANRPYYIEGRPWPRKFHSLADAKRAVVTDREYP